jgi:hypothetical protein
MSYDSVAGNETRIAHIKNLTTFWTDLESETLPQVTTRFRSLKFLISQWMYISPNILNDGINFLPLMV